MKIQSNSANFLIEKLNSSSDCVSIKSDSMLELSRLFGSLEIKDSENSDLPFEVHACKQEYADAMILLVKEIDYMDFSSILV